MAIIMSCLSLDCPEMKGELCWFADPTSDRYKAVQEAWKKGRASMKQEVIDGLNKLNEPSQQTTL